MANPNQIRVTSNVAHQRLQSFSLLSTVVNTQWLNQQLRKPVEGYSLITGWLTTSPDDWNWAFRKNTQALENALALLQGKVSGDIWKKICSKILAKSDRAESKGTLAELSLAVFLVTNSTSFDMETKLKPPKDVDFSIGFGDLGDVHIEMQSLAESDASKKTSKLSADYGGMYIKSTDKDFEHEENRIIDKVGYKIPKLVENEITLVGLDCTAIPEHGGIGLGTIPDALSHILGRVPSALTEKEQSIRQLVDGVIWFQVDYDDALQPVKRGYCLNEHSAHFCKPGLVSWIELWTSSNLQECETE